MTRLFDAITDAICEQLRLGRTQRDIGAELHLSQRTISAIACGQRGIGRRTLDALIEADAPWLRDILAQPLLGDQGATDGAGDPE
jgi:transcriptional regulator with XRE-family HTH domain